MRLTFLGTGSAMPTGDRMQTGLLLEQSDSRLLVDCGSGVLHTLARTDAGYEAVDTVLLTHHHLDHVSDLLPLLKARWLAGEETLTVVGPTGTKGLVTDLLDVHDYLQGRVDLTLRDVEVGAFEVAGFDVDAIETRHSMPGLAYKFDDELAFSADTEAFAGMAEFADGCPVLVHDCSFPDEVDVSNHPTPTQLGESLAGVAVDELYLTHLYPHTNGKHEEMRASVAEHFDGEITVARDGLEVET
ncbi:MBL fold metallo-hydrolase [Halobacterium bonnevillei]|uniref:MBL fold metallo-hydrolase n=1 Tax=Halobacterium bonnevillei TaxID=2692200 RepID=A0A6B0SKJ5_9EURY|nr:MBL fold metallo-hydrolase [Halobacterium bonnevillei]MXR19400.1 MBL fold metallo-hydrolase [Halobacterium bonnevillei]